MESWHWMVDVVVEATEEDGAIVDPAVVVVEVDEEVVVVVADVEDVTDEVVDVLEVPLTGVDVDEPQGLEFELPTVEVSEAVVEIGALTA